MKKLLSVLLALVLCAGAAGVLYLTGAFDGILDKDAESVKASSEAVELSESEPESVSESESVSDTVIRLRAVGDNLIHDSIYKQAQEYAGGSGFDFSPMYADVADCVADADISYINQETIIAEDLYPLSGYPQFNTPKALGEYMVQIGFDVVSVANNHMLDMGESGLRAALDFWESQGVTVFGAWRSESDMATPIMTETDGIKIAWLPIVEQTNGLSLPAGTEMRYILTTETDLMKAQIDNANAAGADFIIAVPHWGTEYSLDANAAQQQLAQQLADWGVDLIIGSHSHTLQPVEWIEGAGGSRTLVAYSLGNFIGNMLYPQNMIGGILDLDITKDGETGETTVTRAEVLPTVIHYEGLAKDIRIYLVEHYSDELAARHGMPQLDALYGVYSSQQLSMAYIGSVIEHSVPAEFRPNLDMSIFE